MRYTFRAYWLIVSIDRTRHEVYCSHKTSNPHIRDELENWDDLSTSDLIMMSWLAMKKASHVDDRKKSLSFEFDSLVLTKSVSSRIGLLYWSVELKIEMLLCRTGCIDICRWWSKWVEMLPICEVRCVRKLSMWLALDHLVAWRMFNSLRTHVLMLLNACTGCLRANDSYSDPQSQSIFFNASS
jgi:hypothetical protein